MTSSKSSEIIQSEILQLFIMQARSIVYVYKRAIQLF